MQKKKPASTNCSVKAAASPTDVKSFKSRGLGDTGSLRMSRMVEDLRAGGGWCRWVVVVVVVGGGGRSFFFI